MYFHCIVIATIEINANSHKIGFNLMYLFFCSYIAHLYRNCIVLYLLVRLIVMVRHMKIPLEQRSDARTISMKVAIPVGFKNLPSSLFSNTTVGSLIEQVVALRWGGFFNG